MSSITVRIIGVDAALARVGPQLLSAPLDRFLRRTGFAIQNRAMNNTRPNVFEGSVINSFAIDVDGGVIPTKVTVSNNSDHALPLEHGSRPHFPPIGPITPWAAAHGISPYALAKSISRKGTRPHPFLEPALNQSMPDIHGFIALAAREIEALGSV